MGRVLDFNGDGKADVIVAAACTAYEFPACTASGYAIVVYLGNGDGTFQPCPQNLLASCAAPYGIISGGPQTSFRAIAVGDFNGDGYMDVVAASDTSQDPNSGSMIILLGNGDGTFKAGASYQLGGIVSQAHTITAGDFNGDGKLDLAVGLACYNIPVNGCSVGAVSIYLGNGDGTFSGPTAYQTVGNSALYPVVGDFNNDGKPDVIAGSSYAPGNNAQSSLTVLLGNGDGTFTQQLYSGQPALTLPISSLSALTTVDLNSDGKLDLAITTNSSAVQAMLGNGDGTFQSPVAYYATLGNQVTNGGTIIAADVNGDGKPDLVVSGSLVGFNGVQVFLNDGTGNLTAANSYTAGGWQYAPIDMVDFNGDGKLDILVASGCAEDPSTGGQLCPDGTLTVLLGNGDGTFRSSRYVTGGRNGYGYSISVGAADFNGDGLQDLVIPGCTPGNSCAGDGFTLLLSDGQGGYQTPQFFSSAPAYGNMYLAVADFNGDGRPDVALFSACDNYPSCVGPAASIFLNTGDPANLFSNVAIYESGGTSMSAQAIAIGDFDGKNGPDIALLQCCTNDGQNLIGILLNKGDGTFDQQPAVTTTVGNASWIAAADFNHDGNADLAVAEYTSSQTGDTYAGLVQILIGNGDGTFTAGNVYSSLGDRGDNGRSSLTIGDIDGDGNADIVIGNPCDERVYSDVYADDVACARGAIGVLLGKGDGTFQPASGQSPNPSVVPDANFSAISLADVNGDGKPDVIASTLTGIYVAFGNGDGTFQPGTVYAGLKVDQNVQLAIADLNNDGAQDIVQPGDNTQLAILYNQGSGTSTATATSVSSSLNPSVFGEGLTLTATVSTTAGTPTGMVTFYDAGTPIGVSTLSGMQSTLSIGSLSAGPHSITAHYGGDSTHTAGTSTVFSLTINQASVGLAVSSGTNPSTWGQSVTLTATLTPQFGGQPSGTVTFTDGTTVLGSVAPNNNLATLNANTLAAGTHSIKASYSGDTNFQATTSPAISQKVTMVTTKTVVISSNNPQLVSQPITFTATVTSQYGGAATGSIVFKAAGVTLNTVALSGNQASLTTSFSTAGARSITAQYGGDTNNIKSTSAALSQSVDTIIPTTTTLSSSLNPAFVGQAVTLTATVTSGDGTPPDGELITFAKGATNLGTAQLKGGSASLTLSTLIAGTNTITASYPGDTTFKTSTSKALAQVVNKYSTTTSLVPSLNPATYGQSITFTATVTSTGPNTPTGKVVFKNGSTTLATVALNGSGIATLSRNNLAAGTLLITATYDGDTQSVTSTSTALSQVVNQASTTTSLTSLPNPSNSGQSVKLTATVTSPTTTPTGTVTFTLGATMLGTGTLAGGKASLTMTTLPVGADSITATYNGTANITGSSTSLTQQVN
jgi:hypothetical protein